MTEIYLAVWYDRHVDDTYTAFHTLDDAVKQVRDWADENDDYEYSTPDWMAQDDTVLFRLESDIDDGPHGWVEKIELK